MTAPAFTITIRLVTWERKAACYLVREGEGRGVVILKEAQRNNADPLARLDGLREYSKRIAALLGCEYHEEGRPWTA